MRDAPDLTRRAVTFTSVLTPAMLAATLVTAQSPLAAVPRGVDLADPVFNMMTLSRLQGDVTDKVTYGFQRGQVFGIREGRGLPLSDYGRRVYNYEGGGLRRSRVRADGAVETRSRGWLLYTDVETGAYLTQFKNPYTEATVDVPVFRAGISGGVLTPQGPTTSANFTMESTVYGKPTKLDYAFIGETAFVSRHAFTRWTPRGETQARTEFTLDVWTCKAADLFNGRRTYIPNTSSWTSQTEWQTWLKMPEAMDGHQIWRADGLRVMRIADLPPAFVAQTNTANPGALSEALTWPA
jgi:hypothetical protein